MCFETVPCEPVDLKLSTELIPTSVVPVDDFGPTRHRATSLRADRALAQRSDRVWLGMVVPKRHARRSVTRSLLKRQIRVAIGEQTALACGLWVVRLRAPFDRTMFPSAASQALRRVARAELDALLSRLVGR